MENKIYDANLQYKPYLLTELHKQVFIKERKLVTISMLDRVYFRIWRFFKDRRN
jgi:hypothetical protein